MKISKLYIVFLVAVSLLFLGSVIHAGTLNHTYDELNRLISAENPDEYRIDYYYDDAGNRTAKVVQLTTPSFDYDKDGDVDGSDLGRPKMPVSGSIFCPLFGPGNIDHNTYYDWF